MQATAQTFKREISLTQWPPATILPNTVYRVTSAPGVFLVYETDAAGSARQLQGVAPHVYAREWHVDPINGNDSNAGTEFAPFKTVAKAQAVITGSGDALHLHAAIYTEAVTWSDFNCDIIGASTGGLTRLEGAWTFAHAQASVRVRQCRFAGAVTHSGAGSLYFSDSQSSGAVTKSGGGYMEIRDSDFAGTGFGVAGAGQVNFYGTRVNGILVNNAAAVVAVHDSPLAVGCAATSGTLAVLSSTALSIGGANAAVSGQAGSTVIIRNTACYKPDGTIAPVSLQGNWSVDDAIYDASTSTLTGNNLGMVSRFDQINARGYVSGSSLYVAHNQARAFSAGVIVEKDGLLYKSNDAIPVNTVFVEGTTGATWRAVSAAGAGITNTSSTVAPSLTDPAENSALKNQMVKVGKSFYFVDGTGKAEQIFDGGTITPAVIGPITATVGTAITPTPTLAATGFPLAPTLSISPALPSGLSFNTATGVVSGTPTATSGSTSYTITATGGTVTATASLSLQVNAAPVVVATPSITTPANGATGVSVNSQYVSSAFTLTSGTDTHLNSDWQVSANSGFTAIIASTSADATNKTTWTPTGLAISTQYWVRVRYRTATGVTSAWSTSVSYTTSAGADGVTWTQRTSGVTSNLNAITYSPNDDLFLAAGNSGVVLTSPDGIAWTSRTSGTTLNLNGAAYAPDLGLFVVVGANVVRTSPDGVTWTARSVAGTLLGVTYSAGNGGFVAVGTTGAIRTSADGLNWFSRTSNTSNDLRAVAYSPSLDLFVAVGASGVLLTSPNGVDWTPRSGGPSGDMNAVTFSSNEGLFVAVGLGTAPAIFTSPNGINWTSRTSNATNGFYAVTYSPEEDLFVAMGAAGVIRTSKDGVTWTVRTGVSTTTLLGVAYSPNDGRFAAVGASGLLITNP